MEDSLHFEEHFEEANGFERKFTDFFSELEDPNSSENPAKGVTFCLGKETEQCDEVSISKVLPAEHILPGHSFEGKIPQKDIEESKPVKYVKKVKASKKNRNVWIGARRKRKRKVQSPQDAIKTEKTVKPEDLVLTTNKSNVKSVQMSLLDSFPSQNIYFRPMNLIKDHTYFKKNNMGLNTLTGTIKRQKGTPFGSRRKSHPGKASHEEKKDMNNQSKRRLRPRCSEESLQSLKSTDVLDNELAAKLDNGQNLVDCQENVQLKESTSEVLAMRKDLFLESCSNEMASHSKGLNNESLAHLNDSSKNQDSQEMINPDINSAKPLLMRKDLFLERDKSHSDTEFYQKLKDKHPFSKTNAAHTSSWNKSKQIQSRKKKTLSTVAKRKSPGTPIKVRYEATSSQSTTQSIKNEQTDDDDLKIIISKVVSFNPDPKFASAFVKSEFKQEPSCSTNVDPDEEYMRWTIPPEWTQGLIDVKSEEVATSNEVNPQTNVQRMLKCKTPKHNSKGVFKCEDCGKSYAYKRGMRQHRRLECMKEPQFPCPYCPTKYRYPQILRDHVKHCHNKAFDYWYSMHYQHMIRRKGIDY